MNFLGVQDESNTFANVTIYILNRYLYSYLKHIPIIGARG